jgi:hypothetical protein
MKELSRFCSPSAGNTITGSGFPHADPTSAVVVGVMAKAPLSTRLEDDKNRWDNVENTPWNAMEHRAKVGQHKQLIRCNCFIPPLGTTIFP